MSVEPRQQALRLFNTLGREVSEFVPLSPPHVGMYSCGPTVYDHQHIGNMRTYVFADTLKRALRWVGFDVRHVINITDVGHLTSDADEGEDKMELAAQRQHQDAWQLAAHYTQLFKSDLQRLNVLSPEVWCRATDHIDDMVRFAQVLEYSGWCYRLPSGLYFDTSKDREYGRLALLDLEGQRAGARVEVAEGKKNARDFAVWRASPSGERRQMEWPSPWGTGAPGWHIECSVMSMKYLGQHFDVHTGGADHPPVHHTNEIAQSQAYLGDGRPWVNWWLHGEFINLKGTKMSKSAGGTAVLQDLVDRGYHPLAYRYLLLQSHYRSQVEFSWEAMDAARTGLRRLLDRFPEPRAGSGTAADISALTGPVFGHLDAFRRAVCDDLHTPEAMAAIFAAARDDRLTPADRANVACVVEPVLGLGLGQLVPGDLDLKPSEPAVSDDEVASLVARREEARSAGDFALSDQLRRQLQGLGITVEDQAGGGSTWHWG